MLYNKQATRNWRSKPRWHFPMDPTSIGTWLYHSWLGRLFCLSVFRLLTQLSRPTHRGLDQWRKHERTLASDTRRRRKAEVPGPRIRISQSQLHSRLSSKRFSLHGDSRDKCRILRHLDCPISWYEVSGPKVRSPGLVHTSLQPLAHLAQKRRCGSGLDSILNPVSRCQPLRPGWRTWLGILVMVKSKLAYAH